MNTNLLKTGAVAANSAGIGTVTRQMVKERAVELAFIDGRLSTEVSKSDWEQAKRELTGGSDAESKAGVIEAAPESERWNPVPGSRGHKVSATASEDEDEEGRSDNERLVDAGMAEAELDQSRQAAPGRRPKREWRRLKLILRERNNRDADRAKTLLDIGELSAEDLHRIKVRFDRPGCFARAEAVADQADLIRQEENQNTTAVAVKLAA